VCRACGLPLAGRTCTACAAQPLALDRLASVFEYRDVARTAVLHLKYRGISGLAEELAPLMAAAHTGPRGLVVPVPLHRDRLRERGYNQAELLARGLASETGFPLAERGLLRAVATPPQARLTERTERFRNMEGAFSAAPELVAGRDVLLIDDVATTGATLNACAIALRSAGARSVAALTFARQL
jgi:ComF family protein